MVNTTRASLMAQISELKHFGIITGKEEMVMIEKVDNLFAKKKLNEALKDAGLPVKFS